MCNKFGREQYRHQVLMYKSVGLLDIVIAFTKSICKRSIQNANVQKNTREYSVLSGADYTFPILFSLTVIAFWKPSFIVEYENILI
jgi:hypothetical protein